MAERSERSAAAALALGESAVTVNLSVGHAAWFFVFQELSCRGIGLISNSSDRCLAP